MIEGYRGMKMSNLFKARSLALLAIVPALATLTLAQEPEPAGLVQTPDDARSHGLESLRKVVNEEGVPLPPNLSKYVKDMTAAAQLGKALFHEQSVGSDAVQACVTCHFNAGADSRSKNQVSPGLLRVQNKRDGDIKGFWRANANPDEMFQIVSAATRDITKDDFPFVDDINSDYPTSNFDVVSSQGITAVGFAKAVPGKKFDEGVAVADPVFVDGYMNVRRVEPRNTPTMINAVFNFTNFWDGRANPYFNGENPFGRQDTVARVYKHDGESLVALKTNMHNASLASQAVGPPLSHFEMSYGQFGDIGIPRSFPDVGRKLLSAIILEHQTIASDDSLLGDFSNSKPTYQDLVRQAFDDSLWDSTICVKLNPTAYPASGNQGAVNNGNHEFIRTETSCYDEGEGIYSLSEANFALFYGLAVMIYEATLVADYSAFDQWMMYSTGEYTEKFGKMEKKGLDIFVNKGKCANCHGGPEMTNASVRNAQGGGNMIEPMIMGDKRPGMYDNGFYNIGVTPTIEDVGRGGNDPFGSPRKPRPLAFTRQFVFQTKEIMKIPFPIIGNAIPNLHCESSVTPDDPLTNECDSGLLGFVDEESGTFYPVCRDLNGDRECGDEDELLLTRVAVDGAFKTPGLRNIALTAPYFHNGTAANLRQVVQFYNRGGIFCRENKRDLDPDIRSLGLSPYEEEALVAFMVSLTDMRTVDRKAPFDHPSYLLPIDGLEEFPSHVTETIDAVGRYGTDEAARLATFLNLDVLASEPTAGFDHFDASDAFAGNCSSDDSGAGTGEEEEGPDWGKGGKVK
jgi:cytochrome c peroxidase